MLVRTKRTWLLVASVVALLALAPCMVFGVIAPTFVLLQLVASLALALAHERWWREVRGAVRADERGLVVDGRTLVTRAKIGHGHVLRRGATIFVRFSAPRRDIAVEVEVADEIEAGALLAAMRLDAGRSVARYPMISGPRNAFELRLVLSLLLPVVAAALVGGGGLNGAAVAAYLVTSLLVSLASLDARMHVSVGADGVHLERLLRRQRFIPFGAIAAVEAKGPDVRLCLHGGETILVHQYMRHWITADDKKRAINDALVSRINERLAQHHAGVDVPAVARAGRDTETWLRDVTATIDTCASFRSPAVPPAELWRIVEDPAALATARAGAAVALHDALDDDGRARLRVLADACAAPRLRVALDAVASAHDRDALLGALEPLEDEPRARARATVAEVRPGLHS
jgi:hypothetical protein